MTLAGAAAASSSGVLAWQLVDAPGTAARTNIKGIQIAKHVDKSSPNLLKACAGGPQAIVLTDDDRRLLQHREDQGEGRHREADRDDLVEFSKVKID